MHMHPNGHADPSARRPDDETPEQRAARRRADSPGGPLGISEDLIAAVVHDFYGEIRRDPQLGPIFARAIPGDWGPHLDKMVRFWSSVLLGSGAYSGRPMPAHIRLEVPGGDGLQDAHFAHWLDLFRATLQRVCLPQPRGGEIAALFLDRAERIAESFKMGLRFHRGQTPDWLGPARSAG